MITRDNVALSDDINAPHFLEIVIVSNSSILEIIKHIIKLNYFPLVEGGKATWSIIFNKKIIVFNQEHFENPIFIYNPIFHIEINSNNFELENLHFYYNSQRKVEEVYYTF